MPNPGYEQNVLREAGHIINDLLHNDIRKFSENETDPKEFNCVVPKGVKEPGCGLSSVYSPWRISRTSWYSGH